MFKPTKPGGPNGRYSLLRIAIDAGPVRLRWPQAPDDRHRAISLTKDDIHPSSDYGDDTE